jgi:hypothetical protein
MLDLVYKPDKIKQEEPSLPLFLTKTPFQPVLNEPSISDNQHLEMLFILFVFQQYYQK